MEDQELTDELLTRVANKAGGIKPLLDTFFSFLARKTDFYVQFDPSDKSKSSYKMGFPIGTAEKMVLQAFRQFELKDYEAVVIDKPVASTTPVKGKVLPQTSQTGAIPLAPSTPPRVLPSSALPPSTPVQRSGFKPAYTPEGKQVPIGNGGIADNYYWTQTLKDVTIYIDTAAGCRGKDVKCVIKPQSLFVEIKGQKILEGTLDDVVKVDESMWTLSSTTDSALQQVVVTLDKTRQTWWKHVVVGHEEIDTTMVSYGPLFATWSSVHNCLSLEKNLSLDLANHIYRALRCLSQRLMPVCVWV
jgi:hypothetical protein